MDVNELDARLRKLEEKLERSATGGEPVIVEGEEKITNLNQLTERIQELEDLLLLIEMENTKIKEKFIGSANLESPVDVLNRIQKLEENFAALKTSDTEELQKKIDDLEGYITKELAEFDKRLARLEEFRGPIKIEKVERAGKYREEKSTILEEVQKILEG